MSKRMSEYQRGYEAALRKVWRADKNLLVIAPERWNSFVAWRSWFVPRRWPKVKR